MVVIAGTGSGAAGRDAAGRTVRVGGHGFLLGDEGGGYWIGREAVRAALRAGTAPARRPRCGDDPSRAFSDCRRERRCTSGPTDRQLLARLVPGVAIAAREGDQEASRILAEAAAHLVDLAGPSARLGPLPVAGAGGIFRCAPVRDAFTAATGAVRPAEPPELGALRLLDR